MGIIRTLTRLADYYSRHGFVATIRRAKVAAKRAIFYHRTVVFYCDLARGAALPADIPDSLKVERLTTYAELNPEELQELTSFWHPKQAHRDIRERFAQGASLWLIRSGGKLAGYGWTLQGRTIAPYFLRLGENDVSLFDFYAFPNFRGRAIHWILIAHILARLRAEGKARAFGDTAEWNQAQLASFKMTPFRPLGLACSFTIFGHTFVSWTKNKPMEFMQKDARRRNEAPTLAMLHER